MDKNKDFSEWYNDLLDRTMLVDKRYPVKGMNVWLPYGWKIVLNIDSIIRKEMENSGHREVYFPMLIPETEFNKEKEHIKGFTEEVYWVTKAGKNDLDINLLLRPTSETAMYPIFSLWIRSHADLPLKVFQIVNTFRYETKQTRSFIRVREMHFFEAHTCHASMDEAQAQIEEDLNIMKSIAEKLSIPYMVCIRPDWDKFPGAKYSLGIDTFMGNKSLQIASIHQYGDNFSKPYNIMFEDLTGKLCYAYQTTYGMSERLVGAIVGVHGDNHGLFIPPDVAPIQVIIIPIYNKTNNLKVLNAAKHLRDTLMAGEIRCEIDDRDLRPGSKFYYWEERGIPIRIEVGEREVDSKTYKIKDRIGNIRKCAESDVLSTVMDVQSEISKQMYTKALIDMKASTYVPSTIDEIKSRDGIFRVPWCEKESCAHKLEETGLKVLGTPYKDNDVPSAPCIVCNDKSQKYLIMAKSF